MIAHGDYCDYDNYVARCHDLTNDADDLANFAESVPATGGGDSPEVISISSESDKDWGKGWQGCGNSCVYRPSLLWGKDCTAYPRF